MVMLNKGAPSSRECWDKFHTIWKSWAGYPSKVEKNKAPSTPLTVPLVMGQKKEEEHDYLDHLFPKELPRAKQCGRRNGWHSRRKRVPPFVDCIR